MFNPKKGDAVSVCYDGKMGRAVQGVVKMRRGWAVLVEFTQWAEPKSKPVQNWFVRTSPESFGGYLRAQDSLMKMLVGTDGDWYSAIPAHDVPTPRQKAAGTIQRRKKIEAGQMPLE